MKPFIDGIKESSCVSLFEQFPEIIESLHSSVNIKESSVSSCKHGLGGIVSILYFY